VRVWISRIYVTNGGYMKVFSSSKFPGVRFPLRVYANSLPTRISFSPNFSLSFPPVSFYSPSVRSLFFCMRTLLTLFFSIWPQMTVAGTLRGLHHALVKIICRLLLMYISYPLNPINIPKSEVDNAIPSYM